MAGAPADGTGRASTVASLTVASFEHQGGASGAAPPDAGFPFLWTLFAWYRRVRPYHTSLRWEIDTYPYGRLGAPTIS